MSFELELQVAKKAVRQAANLTRQVAKTHISSVTKNDKSPVTIGDFGAQAVVIAALNRNFPKDPVVGEEDAKKLRDDSDLANKVWGLAKEFSDEPGLQTLDGLFTAIDNGAFEGSAKGREWALDPIDGTKGFLRKQQYAVCLALIVDAKVQLGVIGCPNLGENGGLFSAVRGQGAFWEPLYSESSTPEPIHFRDVPLADAQFCESVESGHSALDTQLEIAKLLGVVKPPVQMDSQAKYCALAKGDADIYLRLPVSMSYEEKIWDHAAGNVLITEAGGVVSDIYGNELDFGQGRTLKNNKGVIASRKNVHDDIIKVVKKVLKL